MNWNLNVSGPFVEGAKQIKAQDEIAPRFWKCACWRMEGSRAERSRDERVLLTVSSHVLVLFLERAVKSHFTFILHTFLIDFCLSRGSETCQVSINKLERI